MDKKFPIATVKPIAEVETSLGKIYLYSLTMGDFRFFQKHKQEDQWFKAFLSRISSFSDTEKGLEKSVIEELSDDEIEEIANAYISSDKFITSNPEVKKYKNSESASLCLERLLNEQNIALKKNTQKISEALKAHDKFKNLINLTSNLDTTLSNLKNLNTRNLSIEESHNELSDHLKHQAQEKIERNEVSKTIAKMTTQSAEALSELVQVITQADIDSRKKTKHDRILLWITIIISASSLLFSIYTHFNKILPSSDSTQYTYSNPG